MKLKIVHAKRDKRKKEEKGRGKVEEIENGEPIYVFMLKIWEWKKNGNQKKKCLSPHQYTE